MEKSIPTRSGFTFVEVIVVVTIVAILATLVVISVQSVRISGRDARRVNDINQIRSALNLHYAKYSSYPVTAAISPGVAFQVGSIVYMEKVPANPTPRTDGGCNKGQDYIYNQQSNGLSYTLTFCLGYRQDAIQAGENIAIPEGIVPN